MDVSTQPRLGVLATIDSRFLFANRLDCLRLKWQISAIHTEDVTRSSSVLFHCAA
jgi:hypothetical protein